MCPEERYPDGQKHCAATGGASGRREGVANHLGQQVLWSGFGPAVPDDDGWRGGYPPAI